MEDEQQREPAAQAAQDKPTDGATAPVDGAGRRPRSRVTLVVSLVVGVLLAGAAGYGLYWLFTPPENAVYAYTPENRPPKGTPSYDGLVLKATDTKFELQTRQGRKVTLGIRKPDRPYLDVQHAQSHAALGQPVRVYYRQEDGRRYAVYLEDSQVVF